MGRSMSAGEAANLLGGDDGDGDGDGDGDAHGFTYSDDHDHDENDANAKSGGAAAAAAPTPIRRAPCAFLPGESALMAMTAKPLRPPSSGSAASSRPGNPQQFNTPAPPQAALAAASPRVALGRIYSTPVQRQRPANRAPLDSLMLSVSPTTEKKRGARRRVAGTPGGFYVSPPETSKLRGCARSVDFSGQKQSKLNLESIENVHANFVGPSL